MQGYRTQGLTIPRTSGYNIPIFPQREAMGQGRGFVQDHPAINNIVALWHAAVPNPRVLLSSILAGVPSSLQLISAVPSVAFHLEPANTIFCLHLGRRIIHLDSNASGFYWVPC